MVAGLTEHIWTLWEVLLFWAPRCSQPSSTVSWVEKHLVLDMRRRTGYGRASHGGRRAKAIGAENGHSHIDVVRAVGV